MSTSAEESDTARARARAVSGGRSLNQWPLAVVLCCLAAALGVVATGHWRRGSFAVGCSVLLAGALRAVLPARIAGLLVVRGRWFDTALLVLVGGAMTALTLVVPHSPPSR